MIPSDLSARLRMLAEASFFDSEPPIQGPARIRELQARLPELLPGQHFTAKIDRALPDGTFQAVVAGRSYTLALSQSAKAGDTLELVVTQTTPKAVVAQLANTLPGAAGQGSATSLSATGRLISFLLTGQPATQPAALAGGKPLLIAPPIGNGAALAPLLRQALTQSGLFYESHQSKWLAGKVDTASLLGEPQGQQPQAGGASSSGAPARAGAMPLPSPSGNTPGGTAGAQGAAAGSSAQAADSAQNAASAAVQRAPIVPERLLPIVHQQLDALATQTYVWHGQAWPGQGIEWEIEDPDHGPSEEGDPAREWNTTLRLTLPRLGGVEARLHLSPAGLALRVVADDPDTVAALSAAHGALGEALAAADVPLAGFVAERRDASG